MMLYTLSGGGYEDAREDAAADVDAARAREGGGSTGDDVPVVLGVLPVCGDVEYEFGGAGGVPCPGSSLVLERLWLEVGEWPAIVGALARVLIDAVASTGPTRASDAKGLSASGGGVGR